MDSTLLLAMVVVAFSGTIFGMTGFGFALVSVPPLLLLYEPSTIVALTFGISLATSWLVVVSGRHELEGRLVLVLLPGALVGMVAGARVLAGVDPVAVKIVAGAIVCAYSVTLLAGFQPSGGRSPWVATIAGLASGTLATSTGLSGPPIVMLFAARGLTKDAFRSTISAYFVLISLAGLPILIGSGALGRGELVTALLLIPAAMAGTLFGNRLARRLSAHGFRRLTLALLLATGLMGIATAVAALV